MKRFRMLLALMILMGTVLATASCERKTADEPVAPEPTPTQTAPAQ